MLSGWLPGSMTAHCSQDSLYTSQTSNDPAHVALLTSQPASLIRGLQTHVWVCDRHLTLTYAWSANIQCYSPMSVSLQCSDTVGWVTGRHPACKSWVLVCWCWRYDSVFVCLTAPVVTITSIILNSNKIQNGDILVPANPGPPGIGR